MVALDQEPGREVVVDDRRGGAVVAGLVFALSWLSCQDLSSLLTKK